jgi:hypothetical protein
MTLFIDFPHYVWLKTSIRFPTIIVNVNLLKQFSCEFLAFAEFSFNTLSPIQTSYSLYFSFLLPYFLLCSTYFSLSFFLTSLYLDFHLSPILIFSYFVTFYSLILLMFSCFYFFSQPSYSLVRHPFSINGKPLPDTPAKPEDLFAVIELSGTQYKVTLVSCFVLFL